MIKINNKKVTTESALVGGNSNNGGNAGLFYFNSNNAASNANVNIGASLVNKCNTVVYRPKGKHFIPDIGVLVARICEDSPSGIYK